jgi:hypothetical protein
MLAVNTGMANRPGWRYYKPAEGRNHKLKPGYALIGGAEQHHPDAAYYVRWRQGSKTIWRKCSSAADATQTCERQEAYRTAVVHGLALHQTERGGPEPVMMTDALRRVRACSVDRFNSFSCIPASLSLRESCMQETCTCSLGGGRRLARKRASSDPTGNLGGECSLVSDSWRLGASQLVAPVQYAGLALFGAGTFASHRSADPNESRSWQS